jgi:hypothetical protein
VSAHTQFPLHETVVPLHHMLYGSSKGFASSC